MRKKTSGVKEHSSRKWSAHVTEHSHALALKQDIFKSGNARKIALSLKHSAETSRQKKGSAYQSAMSMLNFYINRAGKNLPARQKTILEKAKTELRELFHQNKAS